MACRLLILLLQSTGRLRSQGPQAGLPLGMWDRPGPGIELVSPALAGRFVTTGPPGKLLDEITLCCGDCPAHRWMFSSIRGLYSLNAGSNS